MPEPVVITGPAAGPAGPNPGLPEEASSAAGADAPEPVKVENPPGPAPALRIALFMIALVRRVCRAVATVLGHLIRRYPRHSIAAAASLVILGAISYSQNHSGSGRHDVTNAIPGNQAQSGDTPAAKGAADLKAAAAESSARSDKDKVAATESAKSPGPDATAPLTAQAEGPAPSNLPPPKPDTKEADQKGANAVAKAGAPANQTENSELVAAPAESVPDPAAVPLPAPGSESTKATLLSGIAPADTGNPPPAPASSLAKNEKSGGATATGTGPAESAVSPAQAAAPPAGETALTKKAEEVPSELWLPEGAPKAGGGDAKTDKPLEPPVAAAPPGESKAPDVTKTAPDALKNATEKSQTPSDSGGGGIAPAALSIPATQELPVPKPDKTPESPATGIPSAVEAPISAPRANEPSVQDKQPRPALARGAHEAAAEPSPGEPAAVVTIPDRENVGGNSSGPAKLQSPAQSTAASERGSVASPPEPPARGIERVTPTPAPAPVEPRADASPRTEHASEPGWVSIPNSGRIPDDPTDSSKGRPDLLDAQSGTELGSSVRDLRAHASRDLTFEPEDSQSNLAGRLEIDSTAGESGSVARPAGKLQPRAASHSERVEATEHLVERGENYWTISRQYWGSGRYYRALWKANATKYPDINVLHVGDLIVVPAVEDLDPEYIDPVNTRTRSVSLAGAGTSPRKVAQGSAVASESMEELESRPTARTSARPRSSGGPLPSRPVYRVRTYDTLRSIARDTLGDARRADEILELNRGLIDDPTNLVAGQVLELPDDARTSMRRAAGRR